MQHHEPTLEQPTPWAAAVTEITDLLPAIDEQAFSAIRKEFDDPKRRWFFSGQGRSGLSAKMVAMRVMHMGREAHVLGEVTCPSVRSGDGIVFFSGSGATPVTLAFAQIAREEGANVIAVTSDPNSPLTRLADHTLIVPAQESRQLGGNLFETTALIVMDSLITDLGRSVHDDPNATLRYWHTNMQ